MVNYMRVRQLVSRFMSPRRIVLTALIIMVVSFWLGTISVGIPFIGSEKYTEISSKNKKIKLLEKLNSQLEREVVLVKRSAKVELEAVETMKQALREKDLELLKLNQEVHFYHTLYSPSSENSAIQVKIFDLHKNQVTKRFVYNLVLTRVPKKQEKVTGVIGLSVDGVQQGTLKQLVFEDTSKITDTSLLFSFKYFQKFSGSFSLPDNFKPSSVHVEVLRDSGKKESITASYNWNEVYKDS